MEFIVSVTPPLNPISALGNYETTFIQRIKAYIPLRRFARVDTDGDGYVAGLQLGDCGVEIDLASLGCVLSERLTSLDLSRCAEVSGDLSSLSNCHFLASVLLPSCPQVVGPLRSLCPSSRTLKALDLSWCGAGIGGNLAMLKRPHAFSSLELLRLPGCCPGVTGRIEG